jgi:hypothetical protein
MIDYVMNFEWNGWLGILLFWMPGALCAYGYTVRTWVNYRKDLDNREKEKFYHPTDTIGTLLGRSIMTILPVGNLFAAAFDVGPEVFRRFFEWIGKVFDQPLVPQKKRATEAKS